MVANAAPDPKKVDEFMGRLVQDLGAAAHGTTVLIGDHLGLYRSLAASGPMSADTLASATNTEPRLIRDWLAAQAAAGYVEFDRKSNRFWMTPEQRFVLVDSTGPDVPGAFLVMSSMAHDWRDIAAGYRGKGMGWHEHHADLFSGTERFFRPGYLMNLVPHWLPALEGVVEKLTHGARVADVGCGHGASTIVMAQAFPNSEFHGFDYHRPSIETAKGIARNAGVADRATFDVAGADSFAGKDYDLIAFFDCLHDMGDPGAAAAHVHQALAPDGTWLLVEPFANETLAENLNTLGRIFYSASSMVCAPAALAQGGHEVLGAQTPTSELRRITSAAGFTRFRLASSTPFNRVLEVRR